MYLPSENKNVAEVFENAIIRMSEKQINLQNVNWEMHPEFEGVFLKNIVDSEKSNGMFSFYLMYFEPGAEISNFKHDGMLEVHSVLEGEGICVNGDQRTTYEKGLVNNISDGETFSLRAGSVGLKILVIYAPAYWD